MQIPSISWEIHHEQDIQLLTNKMIIQFMNPLLLPVLLFQASYSIELDVLLDICLLISVESLFRTLLTMFSCSLFLYLIELIGLWSGNWMS